MFPAYQVEARADLRASTGVHSLGNLQIISSTYAFYCVIEAKQSVMAQYGPGAVRCGSGVAQCGLMLSPVQLIVTPVLEGTRQCPDGIRTVYSMNSGLRWLVASAVGHYRCP